VKRATLFALLLLVPSAPAAAQNWARQMFATTSHDFGTVARGSKQEFAFELENVYRQPVRIASVRSSCGCATVQVRNDRVEGSEKTAVVVTYNTRSFLGKQNSTITVVFDRPRRAEVQLQVTGFIRSDVVFQPGAASFGTVNVGSGAETRIDIAYAGRNDWEIVDVRSANQHLEVELEETQRDSGRVSYAMLVRLKPSIPAGYVRDQLYIITNDERGGRVPLPIEGHVQSPLTISPASLFLGVLTPGQTVQKNLVVRGNQPFRILAVHAEDRRFAFDDPPSESKAMHFIPVRFTASGEDSRLAERIEIETDLGDGLIAHCMATATFKR